MKPMILVTSAAGKTGAATVLRLLQMGFPVRALVRRADSRSEALKQRGAEIVVGDLLNPDDVSTALLGASRAYFCAPMEPRALEASAIFAVATQRRRLEMVAVLSQWLASPDHCSIQTRETWIADNLFGSMANVDVVTVDPGWFADNYMAALEPISQFGLMPMPLGDGLNAPPSNEDIARVVAAVIADPAPHVGKTYRPTGPRLLSPQDIAAAYARVLGTQVKYIDAPIWMFSKVARTLGFSDYVIAQVNWYFEDYKKNAFALGAPTDVVRAIGGAEPEDFETIVRRYVEKSPFRSRTLASRAAAAGNMLKILTTPSLDSEKYARDHAFPTRPASLAMDSPRWRAAHARGADASLTAA